jgi:hypothetical protein
LPAAEWYNAIGRTWLSLKVGSNEEPGELELVDYVSAEDTKHESNNEVGIDESV